MTVTFSARRTDQPLQIGSRHGYRIEGDQAWINADLSVPPYHPGGAWALELWASERPYQGGELSGVRVSEVQFELPTPLAPHTHRIDANVSARLPLQGRAYGMLLALVERNGERRVRDVASYPALETFPGPQLQGDVGYEIRGHEVLLQAAAVNNPRPAGNLSGTLSLELWAWPVDAVEAEGVCLGGAQLASLAGGEEVSALQCRAAFSEPPPGNYQLSLLLREWTNALGYLTRDRRDFALQYRVAAPEAFEAMAPIVAEPVVEQPVVLESFVAELVPAEAIAAEPIAAELVAVEPIAAEPVAAEPVVVEPVVVEPVAAEPIAAELVAVEPIAAEPVAAEPVVVEPVVVEPVVVEPVAAEPVVVEPVSEAAVAVAPVFDAEPELDWDVLESVAAPSAPQSVASSAPASVARVSRGVSINTASVEELSRIKGLNTKVAKEIVKKRPFTAIEQLIDVRGIGRKSLDKLRSLVTL